jgi:2-oxo-4-hydroxy-4-carboxy-5-ureidoimidazoline decarboxylase
MSDGLTAFNTLPDDLARAELLAVCSSPAWTGEMLAGRPYRSVDGLLEHADRAVTNLSEAELDTALAGHPKIGERAGPDHDGRGWSRQEQSTVDRAEPEVLRALAAGNAAYQRRFGHVYLVNATGKTAERMLEILKQRLDNDPAAERAVVRGELAKINRIRLAKLLEAI